MKIAEFLKYYMKISKSAFFEYNYCLLLTNIPIFLPNLSSLLIKNVSNGPIIFFYYYLFKKSKNLIVIFKFSKYLTKRGLVFFCFNFILI